MRRLSRKQTVYMLAVILTLVVIAGNILAYLQAWKMTHFAPTGTRTARPESLTLPQKLIVILTGISLPKPSNSTTPTARGMEYVTVHLNADNGNQLSVWCIPADNPKGCIAMFHGYASSKAEQLDEATLFHSLGWTVVMTDFQGSGDSDGDTTTIGFREAGDVATVCDFVRKEYAGTRLVVFGVSMGSAAALRAVSKGRIAPDGLIMECPFDSLLTTVKHRFDAMRVPSFPLAHFLVLWGGVQHGFNGFALNPVEYAESVSQPLLVLQGANDKRVLIKEAESVAAAARGDSTFHLFKKPEHEAYISEQPAEYRDVVSRWLAKIEP